MNKFFAAILFLQSMIVVGCATPPYKHASFAEGTSCVLIGTIDDYPAWLTLDGLNLNVEKIERVPLTVSLGKDKRGDDAIVNAFATMEPTRGRGAFKLTEVVDANPDLETAWPSGVFYSVKKLGACFRPEMYE